MKKELYIITNGVYKGRIGYIDDSFLEKTGNVMFYTIEGKFPYRVCKDINDIKRKNNEQKN